MFGLSHLYIVIMGGRNVLGGTFSRVGSERKTFAQTTLSGFEKSGSLDENLNWGESRKSPKEGQWCGGSRIIVPKALCEKLASFSYFGAFRRTLLRDRDSIGTVRNN